MHDFTINRCCIPSLRVLLFIIICFCIVLFVLFHLTIVFILLQWAVCKCGYKAGKLFDRVNIRSSQQTPDSIIKTLHHIQSEIRLRTYLSCLKRLQSHVFFLWMHDSGITRAVSPLCKHTQMGCVTLSLSSMLKPP